MIRTDLTSTDVASMLFALIVFHENKDLAVLSFVETGIKKRE